ncbi:MAG: DUF1592 domain-containing protein [Phycisphaerales bacterium]
MRPVQTARRFPIRAIAGCVIAALATAGLARIQAPTTTDPGTTDPGTTDPTEKPDELAISLETRYWDDIEPLLAEHCFACHADTKQKGGVRFDNILTLDDALNIADDLATARHLLDDRQMPPEDEPQPTDHEILTIQQWIDDTLDYHPADAPIDPGWFTIHRLNRTEYRNTLRDLLEIDITKHDLVSTLPPDDTGYGFDNIAAVLSMSPLQLEAYLDAADRALNLALGPIVKPSTKHKPFPNAAITRGGRVTKDGAFNLFSNGDVLSEPKIPATAEYEITVSAWAQQAGNSPAKLAIRVDNEVIDTFDVNAEYGETDTFTIRTRIKQGRRQLTVGFINDYYVKGLADRNLTITSVTFAGPLTEESIERPDAYRSVFSAQPKNDSKAAQRIAAQQVIESFASKAFRRPVTPPETESLLNLYDASRLAGDNHEQAARVALTATLVSPAFLYRTVENPEPNNTEYIHQLSGHEIASRLSYFLWSSTPDDQLLSLAESGKLTDSSTLRAQTARMLADERSDAFIENFAGQWLLLRNLDRLAIDQSRYPEYSAELREAMITETTMLFAEAVRENHPIQTLIDSDHTYVNAPLAALYGFAELAQDPPADNTGFQRVAIPPGSARGGVLTTAAVLTVTSNPTRTSPVKRGYYVLDQLLGTPPPPPPPDIPRLENAADLLGENPSLREQLAAHLTDVNCASCHKRMDPIGLSLENFDAIGRWRDRDESGPIDAAGTLPGGTAFTGPTELKQILLAREDLFADNLTRKLLTYALGRGLEPFDRPTVRRILTQSKTDPAERTIPSIIHAIVQSDAFRTCRAPEPRTASRSTP